MAQYIIGLANIDPGDSFLSNNTRPLPDPLIT